jgi:type VI protein secretion system component VasF
MKRSERGLLFLLKKILDEKEDYRVRLYILTWIASLCAMLALVIGLFILLMRISDLFL